MSIRTKEYWECDGENCNSTTHIFNKDWCYKWRPGTREICNSTYCPSCFNKYMCELTDYKRHKINGVIYRQFNYETIYKYYEWWVFLVRDPIITEYGIILNDDFKHSMVSDIGRIMYADFRHVYISGDLHPRRITYENLIKNYLMSKDIFSRKWIIAGLTEYYQNET